MNYLTNGVMNDNDFNKFINNKYWYSGYNTIRYIYWLCINQIHYRGRVEC